MHNQQLQSLKSMFAKFALSFKLKLAKFPQINRSVSTATWSFFQLLRGAVWVGSERHSCLVETNLVDAALSFASIPSWIFKV